MAKPLSWGVVSMSLGATRGFSWNLCRTVLKKRKSSIRASASPRQIRFPAGGERQLRRSARTNCRRSPNQHQGREAPRPAPPPPPASSRRRSSLTQRNSLALAPVMATQKANVGPGPAPRPAPMQPQGSSEGRGHTDPHSAQGTAASVLGSQAGLGPRMSDSSGFTRCISWHDSGHLLLRCQSSHSLR